MLFLVLYVYKKYLKYWGEKSQLRDYQLPKIIISGVVHYILCS